MRKIYLDHAATTKTRKEAVEAMLPYFTDIYANPSAVYSFAGEAKKGLDESRTAIAGMLGAKPEEIYFTSGGTESNNWALIAAADAYGNKGKHIVTTRIEHHAVLHTCEYLKKRGFEITYLDVDEFGLADPEELEKAVRSDTILISIMTANNEIGTIEPVKELGAVARRHGVLFHTDAVQAFAHIPIHVDEMNIDMLSASGHKFYGPNGVGFLYIRKGVKIRSFMHGGAQERKRRAGTVNMPGVAGMAAAAKLAFQEMEQESRRQTELRDYLIRRVLEEIPYSRLNGHPERRLPNNVSFCFRFIEGESMLINLDLAGISASSGSACTSGSLDPSHVLLAVGLPHEIAHGSLRITIGNETTREELDYTADQLREIVGRLRAMSPLYEDFVKKNGNQ